MCQLAVVLSSPELMLNVEFVEEPACRRACDQQCNDSDDALGVESHGCEGGLGWRRLGRERDGLYVNETGFCAKETDFLRNGGVVIGYNEVYGWQDQTSTHYEIQ
jgi:hypothetical protein